jgi:hypothetical protein
MDVEINSIDRSSSGTIESGISKALPIIIKSANFFM